MCGLQFETLLRKILLYWSNQEEGQESSSSSLSDQQKLPRFAIEGKNENLLNLILAAKSLGDPKDILEERRRVLLRKYVREALNFKFVNSVYIFVEY